jgi:hypothetical protein
LDAEASELDAEIPELDAEASELDAEIPELETELSELEAETPELEPEPPELEEILPDIEGESADEQNDVTVDLDLRDEEPAQEAIDDAGDNSGAEREDEIAVPVLEEAETLDQPVIPDYLSPDELAAINEAKRMSSVPESGSAKAEQPPAPVEPLPEHEEAVKPLDKVMASSGFKKDLVTVLCYIDKLLEALPDEKIEEFARSEQFEVYKKLFTDLGLA